MSLATGARLLRSHLREQASAMRRLAAWSALEATPYFVSGLLISAALDRGFLIGAPLAGFGWLGLLAATWGVGAIGTRRVYPRLADTVEPLRDSLATAVVSASLQRAVHGQQPGAYTGVGVDATQATAQVAAVRELLATLLRNTRQVLAAGIAAVAGLAVLSPWIALIVAPCVVAAVAAFGLLMRRLIARYRTVVLSQEQVGAVAAPLAGGLRDIVAQAAQTRAANEVAGPVEANAAALRAFARTQMLGPAAIALGVYVPLIGLLAATPWLVSQHSLSVGAIVGAVYYLLSGVQPGVELLVNAGGTVLVHLGVTLTRLAEVEQSPQPRGIDDAEPPAGHRIEVRDVTFAYSEHAAPVLSGLTLDIPEGRHLAVVGPSGIGKSTLANLLARLATPQGGQLRLGGAALDRIDERRLRRVVALIPQEAYVFAGTLQDNLTYLQPPEQAGLPDQVAALNRAVDAVGLRSLLERLGGYQAVLPPGGGELTPGQRQLIALARVYLSPARVVILDEATCHLDPAAEARAELALADRPGTLIVIAHRISSARRADEILVMDGSETRVGNHDELLARSATYAELVGHWDAHPERPAPVVGPAATSVRSGVQHDNDVRTRGYR